MSSSPSGSTRPVRVGVIGLGAWGKNLLREFSRGIHSVVPIACDALPDARAKAAAQYPGLKVTDDVKQVLSSDVEAIVVSTPPASHFELASAALDHGKDVFVEKPLVLDLEQGGQLVEKARRNGRILMVGHIMEYHPAVEWLKKYIEDGGLGKVYYLYATRVNLGKLRDIENAMWSFAPHDISMISYLLGELPHRVAAVGQSYLRPGIEDVVFLTMWYNEKMMAHVHTSWLDPHKARSLTIVGQKQMAVFSDTDPAQRITIFDKGVDVTMDYNTYAEYLTLRTGEVHIPKVDNAEPLAVECRHFIDRIHDRKPPRSDGNDGLRVLRVLEAAQRSLQSGGTPVEVAFPDEEKKP
ncbi:MAG: Gfo/Idh/MocA family oxidoreductase [candidate division Zixibacteria bacterium]|nr:Gfo/Idh/MocA family oxidoreductase [candidate division Zixibacteria bacterium]